MDQFILIQLLTLYLAILLHLQAFPVTYEVLWSSDISKSEIWGKTTEGQKGSKTKKALFSKKAVNFLLCAFTRDKIRKQEVEWRNTQRTAEDSSYIPLPQHHLSAQPTVPPESPGYTPLTEHGNSSIINPTYFRCLPTSECLFPVTEYGWLTLTSRILCRCLNLIKKCP